MESKMSEKFKYIFIIGGLVYGGLLAISLWFLRYINNETVTKDSLIFIILISLVGGCVWGRIMYSLKHRKS